MADGGDDDSPDLFRGWSRPKDGHVRDETDIKFDYLKLHHFCSVYPFGPDDDSELERNDSGENADREDGVEIRFLSGTARRVARNTPMLTLVLTVVFFGSAELVDSIDGVSTLLPEFSPIESAGILAGTVLWVVMFGLFVYVGVVALEELYMVLVVDGQLCVLTVGTIVSIWLVVTAEPTSVAEIPLFVFREQSDVPPNIVFTSGYLLLILLGGLYVYDGMLRTEHLFENLHKTSVIKSEGREGDSEAAEDECRYAKRYKSRAKELDANLTNTIPIGGGVPTSHVFAVLLVSQFAVGWWIGVGPQNLDYPVTLVGNVIVNVFLVIVAFQFIVLINWIYRLINDDLFEDGDTLLAYEPFHADGRGGYRDLGHFATRVNLLLVIGGFYCLYRLFVQGSRAQPAEMAPGFDPLVGTILWGLSFVGPLLAYAIAAVVWFYYSFWQIHLRMSREREETYSEQTAAFDTPAEWEYREGPAWPINTQTLFTVVTGSLGPIIGFVQIIVAI